MWEFECNVSVRNMVKKKFFIMKVYVNQNLKYIIFCLFNLIKLMNLIKFKFYIQYKLIIYDVEFVDKNVFMENVN